MSEAVRAVDWASVASQLEARFDRLYWEGPGGTIHVPSRRFYMSAGSILPDGEVSDWDDEDGTPQLAVHDDANGWGQDGVRGIVEEGPWDPAIFMEFSWDGFGPVTWYAAAWIWYLAQTDPLKDTMVLATHDDLDPCRAWALARGELTPEMQTALFRLLIVGEPGDSLWGSPPFDFRDNSDVPREEIKQVVREYCDDSPLEAWWGLRESLVGPAIEPNHLKRCLTALKESLSMGPEAWLERIQREGAEIDDEEKEVLLALYMARAFGE